MKRFNFSLERVRRWRSEQASVEELKLHGLRDGLRRLESVQRGVEAELSESESRVLGQSSIDPVELTSLGSYRVGARRKIRELQEQGREYAAKIAEQRQRVLEARRQAELLDRLRAKAFGEWQGAIDREQEELAAELFLARPRRNR